MHLEVIISNAVLREIYYSGKNISLLSKTVIHLPYNKNKKCKVFTRNTLADRLGRFLVKLGELDLADLFLVYIFVWQMEKGNHFFNLSASFCSF